MKNFKIEIGASWARESILFDNRWGRLWRDAYDLGLQGTVLAEDAEEACLIFLDWFREELDRFDRDSRQADVLRGCEIRATEILEWWQETEAETFTRPAEETPEVWAACIACSAEWGLDEETYLLEEAGIDTDAMEKVANDTQHPEEITRAFLYYAAKKLDVEID